MTDDFTKILNAQDVGGWLRQYVEHTRDMEPPTSYHFFSGLAVLGAVLKRRVYLDMRRFRHFPCYQVLLAGPSGVKKSTAGKYAIGIGTDSGHVDALMSAGSPEALWGKLAKLSAMHGEACGILFASEMATLVNNRDYASSMIEVLMAIFDCDDHIAPRETFKHASQPLKNVAVSALFCSNETMLTAAMPAHAMKGGLPSRMITLYETDSGGREVPFPDEMPEPPVSRDWLVTELTRFFFVKGRVGVDEPARKWFRAWYKAHKRSKPPDENLEPFWNRYDGHILKLAIGLSVSEMEDTDAPVMIRARHFLQSDAILTYVVERMPGLYRFLAMGPFGTDYARVIKMVEDAGGEINRKDVQRRLVYPRARVDELVETLIVNGEVIQVRNERGTLLRLREMP